MLILTPKEKRAFYLLLFCFLLGVALYWFEEKELVSGKEISELIKTEKPVAQEKKKSPILNLNEATLAELEEIPGIGPAMAQRIVEYRKAHRRFYKKEELKQVQGVGEKRFQEIEQLIDVR